MQKSKILNEFTKLNCVINQELLEKYVDFCLQNDVGTKIIKTTSTHHILPAAKTLPFRKFSNLSENSWNKAELSYYNHYIAHFMLYEAINHFAIISSFCAMHNKDLQLGRISKNDLISEEEFTKIMLKRNLLIKEDKHQLIKIDGQIMTKAAYVNRFKRKQNIEAISKRMRENNIVKLPGVLEKLRKTKSETIIDGKNLDTISAERSANTMKQEIILPSGEITTIYKENGKKLSKYLNEQIIDDNGNVTTIAKIKGKMHSKKLIEKGKFYKLKNVFDKSINEILSAIEIRNICGNLESKTQDNYLGKALSAQSLLKKNGKSQFIGAYVEILSSGD